MKKNLLNIFFFWVCVLNLHAQVASRESNLLESKGIMAFRPIDIMSNPQTLMKVWMDDTMPLSFYTPKEKEVQKLINEKTEDAIITFSPLHKEKEWEKIDFEEITPFTWKWIDLELTKKDGTLSKIHLRRPHWWFKELKADKIGNKVYLDMPEMGIIGFATIKNIRINQLDTRFWNENRKGDYVSRPITGKFEHESNDVYYLHFGDNPNPLGVTGLHPIWSIDRNDWVEASELKIGEKVKTQEGLTVLKSRTKSNERQKVYNLEIYKDHNFLVSTDKILVHNNCIDDIISLKAAGNISGFQEKLKKFDFGSYLENTLNVAKSGGMTRPHAHHIVMKIGGGEWAEKSRTLLEKYDIDPYFGKENLVWAPNGQGNHKIITAQTVYETLNAAESGGKDSVIKALQGLGEKAAKGEFMK